MSRKRSSADVAVASETPSAAAQLDRALAVRMREGSWASAAEEMRAGPTRPGVRIGSHALPKMIVEVAGLRNGDWTFVGALGGYPKEATGRHWDLWWEASAHCFKAYLYPVDDFIDNMDDFWDDLAPDDVPRFQHLCNRDNLQDGGYCGVFHSAVPEPWFSFGRKHGACVEVYAFGTNQQDCQRAAHILLAVGIVPSGELHGMSPRFQRAATEFTAMPEHLSDEKLWELHRQVQGVPPNPDDDAESMLNELLQQVPAAGRGQAPTAGRGQAPAAVSDRVDSADRGQAPAAADGPQPPMHPPPKALLDAATAADRVDLEIRAWWENQPKQPPTPPTPAQAATPQPPAPPRAAMPQPPTPPRAPVPMPPPPPQAAPRSALLELNRRLSVAKDTASVTWRGPRTL